MMGDSRDSCRDRGNQDVMAACVQHYTPNAHASGMLMHLNPSCRGCSRVRNSRLRGVGTGQNFAPRTQPAGQEKRFNTYAGMHLESFGTFGTLQTDEIQHSALSGCNIWSARFGKFKSRGAGFHLRPIPYAGVWARNSGTKRCEIKFRTICIPGMVVKQAFLLFRRFRHHGPEHCHQPKHLDSHLPPKACCCC